MEFPARGVGVAGTAAGGLSMFLSCSSLLLETR